MGTSSRRRDYGTHSVYQRATDGRWLAAIDVGWSQDGTRRRITVSAKTEAAVKVKLRQKLKALEDAGDTGVSSRTTLRQYAGEWLDVVERDLRPGSFTATRSAVTQWIVPTIGHKRFDQLGPRDVRAVADAQRAHRSARNPEGLSSSTQRRTHSVLVAMLKAAQADGYAVPPRLLSVKAPARSVSDREALTVDQAIAVLGVAAGQPDGSRWAAALLQGWRQGETLGMTWPELDLERGLAVVSWQLQPLPYRVRRDPASGFRIPDGYEARQLKGRMHLVRPKSAAGWRVTPLVPWMVDALKAWQAIAPSSPQELVWPAADGGPRDQKKDDAAWYALQKSAGVQHTSGRPYGIHEARHTTATLLLEAGVDPAVTIAILGHSSIVTSRGYQHVRGGLRAEAMAKVAERLAISPPVDNVPVENRPRAVGN